MIDKELQELSFWGVMLLLMAGVGLFLLFMVPSFYVFFYSNEMGLKAVDIPVFCAVMFMWQGMGSIYRLGGGGSCGC